MFHVSTIKNRFKMRVSETNKIIEFLNNLCGGLGVHIKRPDTPSASNPPVVELKRNELKMLIDQLTMPEVPEDTLDHSDDGTVPVMDGDDPDPWSWIASDTDNAGGGLVLDAYCLISKPVQNSVYHDLRRVRLTFTDHGMLAKAEMQPDGIRIDA